MKKNRFLICISFTVALLLSACNALPSNNSKKASSVNKEPSSAEVNQSSTADASSEQLPQSSDNNPTTSYYTGFSLPSSSGARSTYHRHSWGDYVTVQEATCLEAGLERRTCSVCGETMDREVAALGHNFIEDSSKTSIQATCTEQGKSYEVCSRCNEKRERTVDALGHAWVDASDILGHDDNYIAPQIGVAGQKTQVCSRCNAQQIVIIKALMPNPSTITSVPDNDFHNLAQYKFLHETDLTKYKTYANGTDLSAPSGMKLRFEDIESASKYYVQVADSEAGLASAKVNETTEKVYTFHNAKLSTKYYYRAATSEAGLSSAQIRDITSTDLAPRVVYVPEVLNFRDIGGWETSLVSGAKINEGLYFRCAQLDAASGSTKSCLDSAGKGLAALKELGIKCDIDMRDSYNQPSSGRGPSKANTTAWPISFVSAAVPSGSEPVRWEGGSYQGTDIAAQYVKIFNAIANCDNEPVMLHCTYGADRTGIVTFFLESLLGMSIEDMTRDYLWTQFTKGRNVKILESEGAEFPQWISKTNNCEGSTFADKMKNHLMSFGIEESKLEHIREIFVPGYVAQA